MTAAFELIGGLLGLVISGTAIVRGASVTGTKIGLPPLVIGLTIVAAGTSAPELAVVWRAADQGEPELALGSVVGSNIANVLLVLGIVAVIRAINVSRQAVTFDAPAMIGVSVLVILLGLDNTLDQTDGFILVACLIAYIATTIVIARRSAGGTADAPDDPGEAAPDVPTDVDAEHVDTVVLPDRDDAPFLGLATRVADSLPGAILVFAIGAVGVAISAQFVVSGAGSLAISWGMSELVVGLTVVAIGTSAPEIATSVIAAFRGQADVALGNVIGSNIFNLLFVLGLVSAAQSDLPVDDALLRLDLPVMLATSVLLLPYAITRLQIERIEGAMFLVIYVAYTTYLVLDGTGNDAAGTFGVVALAVVAPLALLVIASSTIRRRWHERGRA